MNGKFFDLSAEKQDRMLNGILKVFALQGYSHASTDDIVREAGISKGLLFHYFENKLGAYVFAYSYAVRFLSFELKANVPKEADLFDTLKGIEISRMHACTTYPYMQLFLNTAETEDVSEALVASESNRNELDKMFEKIYAGIDTGGLPKGVDCYKILKIMDLTIKGLMKERIFDASYQPEMFYEEVSEYIELMRKIVNGV